VTPSAHATADREARLRRSLRRLGYDMVVDNRGWLFHIRRSTGRPFH